MDPHLKNHTFPSPKTLRRRSPARLTSSFSQRSKLSQKGSALIMASIFMIVATYLVTIGAKLVSDTNKQAKQRELFVGEAENVARAGLIDAKAWFIRQTANGGLVFGNTSSSVTVGMTPTVNPSYTSADQAFNPIYNASNPQGSDTSEPNFGIVQEYPLDQAVTSKATYWARYEIKRQPTGAYDPTAVHDVTGKRNDSYINGDGLVWNIISTGYVYKRMDRSTAGTPATWVYPYNYGVTTGDFGKTKIIAKAQFSTEIRKLSLIMPVPSNYSTIVSSGLYVQEMANQITLHNQTLLSGAVSAIGTYAAVGENQP